MTYVCHCYGGSDENVERARQITHELQMADLDELYICPVLALSHIEYGELGYDEEIELCFELLEKCNRIIVASEISEGVRREIEYARRHDIPIQQLAYIRRGDEFGV